MYGQLVGYNPQIVGANLIGAARMIGADSAGIEAAIAQRNAGMVVEQDHPVLGKIKLPNLPFRFSGCDTTIHQVAPDLGQDNAEIAASVGFSAEQIADMQKDGVLYSA